MDCFRLISFESDLGWVGLLITNSVIQRVKFGPAHEIQLLKSFDESFDVVTPNRAEKSWARKLQKYASGQPTDLESIPIDLGHYTPFQSQVLKLCRQIPFGQTISYGELADKASRPRAARAVGSTMKKNRYPLVVPCHRVVSSNGIGGYSAASGISVKQRLLQREGVCI